MNVLKPITIAVVRPGSTGSTGSRNDFLKNTGDDTSGKQLIGKGKKLTASALRGALANRLPVPANGAELSDKCVRTYPAACSYMLAHKRGDGLCSVQHTGEVGTDTMSSALFLHAILCDHE